jgi:hypothetical protein
VTASARIDTLQRRWSLAYPSDFEVEVEVELEVTASGMMMI